MELSLIAVFHRNYVRKKSFFDILDRKQSFLVQKIDVLRRAKKWTLFKGVSPSILSKNRTFSYRRFSQKSYQKRSFLTLWKEKNDFKRRKLKFEKGPKYGHFPKGLVHGFCPKIELSLFAFFHRNYVSKDRFSIFWIESNHF